MAKIFKKGSQAAKDHMAKVRAAKKISGTSKKVKQKGTSNTLKDKMYSALPPGIRKSKTSGKFYSEVRKNRSDAPGKLTGVDSSDPFILKSIEDLKSEYKRLESWNIKLSQIDRKKIITNLKKLTLLMNKRYLYTNK